MNDILSPMVVGAAHACYMTKRIRKPAELLTVAEIAALEDICINDDEDHRRLIAGHLLFCFAAAARWHDSMYVVSMDMSHAGPVTLIEAMTSKHKSSRGKEQQMELLPFTALGQVTHEDSWGNSWMDARDISDVGSWNHFLNSGQKVNELGLTPACPQQRRQHGLESFWSHMWAVTGHRP